MGSSRMASCLNEIGLVLNFLGAVLLAWCSDLGIHITKEGFATLGGHPVDMPNDEKLRRNRFRRKKAAIGLPVGWLLFAAGFALQILALHI